MERELVKFGGGVSQTVLNPLVILAVLLAGILIMTYPRQKVLTPFIAAAILIPTDQVLLIGPLHFMMLRILIWCALVRIAVLRASSPAPLFSGGMNRLDKAVVLTAICAAINWILLWREMATVIYQLGEVYTICGTYVIVRFFIRDQQDIERAIRTFAYVSGAVAIVMLCEQATGWNPYALLGGARAGVYGTVMERENRFRATGCFGHPILAGTFGAVLLPLFVALWRRRRNARGVAGMGVIAATIMTVAANSSTPILGYAAGLFAIAMWPLRGMMRLLRWGLVIVLVSLHMVMKAPVWNLIARIDISGGSSADHRYQLVNQFILHFSDWWAIGVKNNGQWGWDMWDTANQYVNIGQTSGLLPFALFIATIVYGFKYAGRSRVSAANREDAVFRWSLGGALFSHVVSFFGISYFDQTIVAWYALLAMISCAYTARQKTSGIASEMTEGDGMVAHAAGGPWRLPVKTVAACVGGSRQ